MKYQPEKTMTTTTKETSPPSAFPFPREDSSRILIVDDEPVVREVWIDILTEMAPHQVEAAADGEAALEKWREASSSDRPYELMLVDLKMPRMDGATLIQEIRKTDQDLAIIVLTGHGILSGAYLLIDQYQISDFLYKPVDSPEVLLFSVKKALENQQLRQYYQQTNLQLEQLIDKHTQSLEQSLQIQESITDNLIQTATELQRAKEQLEQFQSLIDRTNDAIFVIDAETSHCLEVNQKACSNLGYSREELLQLTVNDIQVSLSDHFSWKKFIQKVRSEGFVLVEGAHRRKDGTTFPVESNVQYVFQKQRGYFAVIVRDITERKRREKEQLRLEKQLHQSQKLEALGTLAGGTAHEFNNLLVPILGFSNRVQAQLPPESKEAGYLTRVIQAAQHAKTLVEQILAFGRKTVYHYKPLQLSGIVSETLKLVQEILPANISIRYEFSESVFPIMADPSQIQQVILNLCINARDAMEEGGDLSLTIQPCQLRQFINSKGQQISGSYVCLSVRDTGHGMDERIIEQIFDPFFTTKGIGKGTGLGLSMVLGIVEQHQGFIEIESQLGMVSSVVRPLRRTESDGGQSDASALPRGTTFHIYWPAADQEVESPVKERESLMAGPAALHKGNGSILLIDDDEDVGEVGKLILEDAGYRVTFMTSSLKALAAFQIPSSLFDLVITDYTMPQMTGIQLAEKLREIQPDIPIILCTGHNDIASQNNLHKWGMSALLAKPYGTEELGQIVRQTLNQKRSISV